MSNINLNTPYINKTDISFINKKLKAKAWVSTAGREINKLENLIVKFTKSKYAICCVNGTSALHISLIALGCEKDQEILCPDITFIAPINAIRYVNCNPVFMDCDKYHNIDVIKLEKFLKNNTYKKKNTLFNKKTKKKIFGIIAVHVWGNLCDANQLIKICKQYNLKLIEDASEALGSYYIKKNKKKIHAGLLGDVGVLSFNGNKIITTGGGGAIVTNNKKISKKIKYLINQAKSNDNFLHNDIGYNYRMPNLNALLGISQFKKLKKFINQKKNIHKNYIKLVKKIKGVEILPNPIYSDSNNWMNILVINKKIFKKSIYKIKKKFENNNIETRLIWKRNSSQKMYKNFTSYMIKNSKKIIKSCLCIPSSTHLTKIEQCKIIKVLKNENTTNN